MHHTVIFFCFLGPSWSSQAHIQPLQVYICNKRALYPHTHPAYELGCSKKRYCLINESLRKKYDYLWITLYLQNCQNPMQKVVRILNLKFKLSQIKTDCFIAIRKKNHYLWITLYFRKCQNPMYKVVRILNPKFELSRMKIDCFIAICKKYHYLWITL